MKFSTGSSSSSSLASDSLSRKSTLCIYTDSDFLNGPEKMELTGTPNGQNSANEAAELKRELANVHRALRLQSAALARQQQRSGDLALRLASQNAVSTRRIQAKDQQFTTLLHALLILEAKLKSEQKSIYQQLQIKNNKIRQQSEQINNLRHELTNKSYCRNCQNLIGSTSEQTNIETDPEFHSLESVESHNKNKFERSLSYHEKQQQPFQKNSRLSKSFQLPKNETNDNTSSSEEVFENGESSSINKGTYVKNKPAFVRKDVTRRSRKFSGRRHSSAYLDNVQKRQNSRNQMSSSSADDAPQSEKESKFHSNNAARNYDIGEEISKDIERASNRIDELLNASQSSDTHIFNDSIQLRLHKGLRREESLSSKIENLHGIRKPPLSDKDLARQNSENNYYDNANKKSHCSDKDKPWYTNSSDPEPDVDCQYRIKKEKLGRYRCKSADDILTATFNGANVNSTVNNKIPSEYLPLPNRAVSLNENERIVGKHDNDNVLSRLQNNNIETDNNNKSRIKNIDDNYEINNVKFENEPSENWYASASDQDDDHSCGIYKNNPVLECVNQILLQNNLDESGVDIPRTESTSPKASTKRVQFSTLNSISFEEHVKVNEDNYPNNKSVKDIQKSSIEKRSSNKIVKFSLETASEHSYEVPISSEGFNYEVQSIYSNDYEPIITKPCNIPVSNVNKSKLRPVPLPRNNVSKANDYPKKLSLVKNMALNLESKINNNHYVDMEAKFGHAPVTTNRRKVPRTPPALPPKPKNLVPKVKLNNLNANGTAPTLLNSDSVELNQRPTDVPNLSTKAESLCGSTKSNLGTEPDYCSISEINVPVISAGKKGMILSQTTVEIHAEQFSPNIAERRPIIVPKMATISKIVPNKISDKDIPKLPQVTEIIIPDDDDDEIKDPIHRHLSHDSYNVNASQNVIIKNNKIDNRNSIQIGHSVSSILNDIKNRNSSIEDVNKCLQYPNMYHKVNNSPRNHVKSPDKPRLDIAIIETVENECEKFDLSQNFEEFKIDDCEFTNIAMAEEYKISSSDGGSTDSANDDTINVKPLKKIKSNNDGSHAKFPETTYKIEFTTDDDFSIRKATLELNESADNTTNSALKNYPKLSNKPDLLSNIENVETDSVPYSDIESSNSSSSNCGSYNTVKCEPTNFVKELPSNNNNNNKTNQTNGVPFEYFLETRGLSSKSILTPSRPPNSNHKNVLKPKDIKMRSKNVTTVGRATPLYEKCQSTAIKYFEPYL